MELLAGEEIVWSGRPSWRSMLAFYIKWMLLALAIGVAAQVVDYLHERRRRTSGGSGSSTVVLC